MWSAKKIKSRESAGLYNGSWGGGWIDIHYNKKYAFRLEEWMLHSCSLAGMHKFDGYVSSNALNNSAAVESLIDFLEPETSPAWFNQWRPNEFLFLLSPLQTAQFAQFIKNPHVKLLDQYKNKSHGENIDSLFRFSFAKDFHTKEALND